MTSTVAERRALIQKDANAQLFIDTLQHYRQKENYKLWAFVIMRDHVHVPLTTQDITLERAVQLIKGGFSRRLESKFPVWQRGFSDRRVRDRAEFNRCVEYIHHNPVNRGYCAAAEDYRWSSAWSGYAKSGPSADLSG